MTKRDLIFILIMTFLFLYNNGGCAKKSPDRITNNIPPTVTIDSPTGGTEYRDIEISYTLVDNESEPCSISVEYSIDDGLTFQPASLTGTVAGLTSSPTGVSHTIIWNSSVNFGENNYNIILSITPRDPEEPGDPDTASFTVDNTPDDSQVIGVNPTGPLGGDIIISYTLLDPAWTACHIKVEYSIDGAPYQEITPVDPLELLNRSSSPGGTPHTVVWDSVADLGNIDQADLLNETDISITPQDTLNMKYGQAGTTAVSFRVDNIPRTIQKTIFLAVDSEPFGIAFTPDSAFAYVANNGDNTVSVINNSHNVATTVSLTSTAPIDVVVGPTKDIGNDCYYVFVACNMTVGAVDVIETKNHTVVKTIPSLGKNPYGITVSPDGDTVYVSCMWTVGDPGSGSIEKIDISSGNPSSFSKVGSIDMSVDLSNSCGIAITPNGNYLFVADKNGAKVAQVDTGTENITVLSVGTEMWDVMVDTDGVLAYAADLSANLHIINADANTLYDPAEVIEVARSFAMAMTPLGEVLYVCNPGTGGHPVTDPGSLSFDTGEVQIVSPETHTEIDIIINVNPRGIAVAPNGKYVYVTDVVDDTVEVIGF